jgi:multidrug efflux pump subunit AcrA (membrane-fusion protein)
LASQTGFGARQQIEIRLIQASLVELAAAIKDLSLRREETRTKLNALLGLPQNMPMRIRNPLLPPHNRLDVNRLVLAAFVNPRLAEKLKGGESATLKTHDASYEARVWRIDPVSKEAVNSVEAILQILDPRKTLKVGEFVSGSVTESGAKEIVLTIPRSAVLETAVGKFAFVQNGDYLLRTLITTGAENADYAEITDGIYAGDVVATNPVETLYLIELRATKGGGHSH